ncbi:MAG: cellulase family glycosylhydrolase, partial [Spirochaetaceae bacterium]|nr:cellulase family glycosylhydrolase [Spirochaetaceae bacterium]
MILLDKWAWEEIIYYIIKTYTRGVVMKKLYSFIFAMLFLFSATFVFAAKTKEVPKVEKTMPFSKGINLGEWLCDYGNGNVNSSYFERQDFDDMKALGIEIVRLNIMFEEFSSGKPDYIVEDWLWEKIDNTVEWCTELKMYMIITFMNNTYGGVKTKPDVEKMLLKIWPQITARYKDSSEYILYEIYNEPHFMSGNLVA